MSRLALYVLHCGGVVSGYDQTISPITKMLESKGIKVYYDNTAIADYDIAVYSSAIKNDDIELKKARLHSKPVFERHEFLSLVANQHKKVYAIAGTHGKTTTTALVAHVFEFLGIKATAHIGGDSLGLSGDYGDIFLTEACEYKKSFLSLHPNVGVILNAERDHPDFYPTDESYILAFNEFLKNIKQTAVIDYSLTNKLDLPNLNVLTVGESTDKDADIKVKYDEDKIEIVFDNNILIRPQIKGKYNAKNIAFAYAACRCENIDDSDFLAAIETFKGVKRRYEHLSYIGNAEVILDYAHHPTEIESAIKVEDKKTLIIFQPHTYSRTAEFLCEFKRVLSLCDEVGILKTYSAREKEEDGVNASILAKLLNATYFNYLDEVYHFIVNRAQSYERILIVGAGDIGDIRKYFQL